MNPERWQKVESIVQKALDADSGHRASVLEDSCAGDESLRREANQVQSVGNRKTPNEK
jgi:hypothetical protein